MMMQDLPTAAVSECVYVVEDDDAIRDAIGMLMRSVELPVELFASGVEFLKRARSDLSGCLILDIRMPEINGTELFKMLREASVEIPVILISAHANVRQAVRAVQDGAFDVLEKPFNDQELLDRIYAALRQSRDIQRERAWVSNVSSLIESLTPREKEVFRLIVSGSSNKEIAGELEISTRTVENHRAQVIRKLRAKSIPDLVRIAIRLGISND